MPDWSYLVNRSDDHVNILIVILNDIAMGNDLKAYLGDELETEGLGMLKYFLGLQVARSTKGIVILQQKYT